MCDSPDLYSPDFEEFWKAYPNFNRDKKGTFKAYQACLKGTSRINKATPEQLLRAARRYAEEVRDREKRYILHGTTFLGPSERWKEFDMPLKNLNGEILREDIDPEDFREGSCINYKKLEAAKGVISLTCRDRARQESHTRTGGERQLTKLISKIVADMIPARKSLVDRMCELQDWADKNIHDCQMDCDSKGRIKYSLKVMKCLCRLVVLCSAGNVTEVKPFS